MNLYKQNKAREQALVYHSTNEEKSDVRPSTDELTQPLVLLRLREEQARALDAAAIHALRSSRRRGCGQRRRDGRSIERARTGPCRTARLRRARADAVREHDAFERRVLAYAEHRLVPHVREHRREGVQPRARRERTSQIRHRAGRTASRSVVRDAERKVGMLL